MPKYHINRETGRPNICYATIRDCPIGGEHFNSKEEARNSYENKMSSENIKTLRRKTLTNRHVEEMEANKNSYFQLASELDDSGLDVWDKYEDTLNEAIKEKDNKKFKETALDYLDDLEFETKNSTFFNEEQPEYILKTIQTKKDYLKSN